MSNKRSTNTREVRPSDLLRLRAAEKAVLDEIRGQSGQSRRPKTKKKQRQQQGATPQRGVGINLSKVTGFSQPKIQGSKGSVTITHTEFITQLTAPINPSGVFVTLTRLRINPGSSSTFIWLSRMAPLYEFYRFKSLRFHFVTKCPTTQAGTLIMSPDYDSADGSVAITEQYLVSNEGTRESPLWMQEVIVPLNTSRLNALYKRHVNMSDTRFGTTVQDQKTVDAAQFFVCTDVATSSPLQIGKLLVSYEVELFIPQAPTDPVVSGGFQLTSSTVNGTITSSAAAPFSAPLSVALNQQEQEPVPILDLTPAGVSYPTSIVGRATRDWSGVVTSMIGGTGLSGWSQLYSSSVMNNAVNNQGDLLQPEEPSFHTFTGTTNTGTAAFVTLKAGQYLKMIPAITLTSLSAIRMLAGGTGIGADTL